MLNAALEQFAVPHQVFYALKANRHPELLAALRASHACGIDVCSPRELQRALDAGFDESEITYTGTAISPADWEVICACPGIAINCDSLSSVRQLGERNPGREIGLRINPQLTASHLEKVSYAGEKASKFGIYPDRFDEALSLADRFRLRVTALHVHSGSGYLNPELKDFGRILDRLGEFVARAPSVTTVDIGGGLGVPLRPGEQPLDLIAWAEMLSSFIKPLKLNLQVEPGDFLVKDAGILLLEVCAVEEKGGTEFVYVNGGFNLSNLYAYYGYPNIVIPLRKDAGQALRPVTVAGNINEGIDLLGEDVLLPPLKEGDVLAFLNVGGYSASSSSDHCMRGDFQEVVLAGAS
ncbi:MAG: diaminopimelate decarboxylase [Pseudomonadota bacterium]